MSDKYKITKEDQYKFARAARRQAEIDSGLLGLRAPKVWRTHKKDKKRDNNVKDYS